MPKGFTEMQQAAAQQSGGGSDFFDLSDGDIAELVLVEEPFSIPVHTLEDPSSPYGKSIPCGLPDLGACPICEDTEGRYTSKQKRTKQKAYFPVFIATHQPKGKPELKVNEMRVLSGGARLIDGFSAAHQTQEKYGGTLIGKPIVASRKGADASTTFSIQMHPAGDRAKIEPTGEPADVETIATRWIEKTWDELGFKPKGFKFKEGAKPDPATVEYALHAMKKPADGDSEEKDPFETMDALSQP